MWQRASDFNDDSWNQAFNGDGFAALDGREYSVSLQHPWLAGTPFFAPENWAPTYDYPLICYLHDDNRSEQDFWKWFPAISDQNYLGLAIRAPFPAQTALPGQFRWRGQRPDATAAVLEEAIGHVQENWNVHLDRIVLFGEGNGAIVALQQLILNQFSTHGNNLRFSGVICRDLPAWWARALPPVADFSSGRVLLLDPLQKADDQGETPAAIDGLSEAGFSVTLNDKNSQSPAGQINQWMMAGISSAIF